MHDHKKLLVVHCADTYATMDIGAKEICRWHLDRGWDDIGYAYVIKRNGTLELGRDLDDDGDVLEETGAHVAGHNRESIGICLVGGKSQMGAPVNNFTEDQMSTLRAIIATLLTTMPQLKLMGHCDFKDVTKTCPNFNVTEWYNKFRRLP